MTRTRLGILTIALLAAAPFVLGATPRARAIPHSSPETFERTATVRVQGGIIFEGEGRIDSTVFVDGGVTIGGTTAQYAVVGHQLSDAGRPQMAIETRVITMSSNTATYVFKEAFAYPPICTCGDTTITTPVACSANTPTVTQVVLFSIGASAVVNVICIGAR